MTVSVVICTRNRGASIQATLHSVLAGTLLPDELLVVDQSDGDETREAVEAIRVPEIRYLKTSTRGLSLARNFGVEQSCGKIIAFTDDDVIVCPDWLERVVSEFSTYPRLALLFGTVLPPNTYDPIHEFIPYTRVVTRRPVPWWSRDVTRGIGANMSLRRTAYKTLGGFDPLLGPGNETSGEDYEYGLRCVCHQPPLSLHLLDEARVIHHAGARRGDEYYSFVHRMNGTGMGLFWAYLMTERRGLKFRLKAVQGLIAPLGGFIVQMLRGKKPSGLRTYAYCLKGVVQGIAHGSHRPEAS